MKKWFVMLALGASMISWIPSAQAFQLQDCVTDKSDPIDIWRVMRPQDFVGAPTLWQILV